jgi:hypothetical protein
MAPGDGEDRVAGGGRDRRAAGAVMGVLDQDGADPRPQRIGGRRERGFPGLGGRRVAGERP